MRNDQWEGKLYRGCQYLISMLILWSSVSMSIAQDRPAPLPLTLDSLQKNPTIGYSLRQARWLFHSGHQANWASPTVDDRTWVAYPSSFNPPQTPPGWMGVGWFRLYVQVDSSLVGPLLAMRLWQRSASEIYLDGQRIGRFGQIGDSPATHMDVFPHDEPLAFHFTRPGKHVLAVRLAARQAYFSRSMWNKQGFIMQIGLEESLTRLVVSLARVDGFQLALAFATGLFALLHLILFVSYPARMANLYYSGWLILSTLDAVCAYLDVSLQDPVWQDAVSRLDIVVNFSLATTSVAFIYSVAYPRQPRRIWFFCLVASLLSAFLVLDRSVMPYYIFFGFLTGCTLEVLRVVIMAFRRELPGVWLIGVGMVVVSLVFFAGPANLVGLWQTANVASLYQQALFTTFGYLVLPLCTSIYLAQDFARTNRKLEAQLNQVRDLSAKTLAQEAEKRQLVTQQNQQLEQTVRQRTEQLQQQADKLREMDGIKSRFFTNLTHEFRTPLTLMLGPAEQVLAQTQEATTKQQVGLLQRNAQRLLRLINQLLELSKLEAGKTELILAPHDWVGLVRGTLHSFESLAYQKRITLQLTSDREQLVMAMDRPKLETILFNLFSNALKFTPAQGTVSVELTGLHKDTKAWIELRVTDTGMGIRAEKLPYVFDRFYQADASVTRQQEGTGIGLALTKELVERHGGSIGISSQESSGTTVTVRLPISQQPSQEVLLPSIRVVSESFDADFVSVIDPSLEGRRQPTAEPVGLLHHPAVEPSTEAPLVLLIEDNEEVRAFIRSSLGGIPLGGIPLGGIPLGGIPLGGTPLGGTPLGGTPLGGTPLGDTYRILEAGNGEAGIQLAQEQVPDLVITDLMMPRLDGYQVCTALRQDERTSHIPIIMLTARADLDSKLEGLQTGADVYLAKPFHQRELLAQMTNLLHVRRELRERYSRATLGRATPGQPTLWQPEANSIPSMEQVFLDRVRAALEAHLDDEQYSVERLSEEVGLGRTQLHRKLKALLNQSPGELLRVLRLQRAHDLLRGNVGTVAEVAYLVGFGNPANFSTSFSRHFGYPPSEVRKKVGVLGGE